MCPSTLEYSLLTGLDTVMEMVSKGGERIEKACVVEFVPHVDVDGVNQDNAGKWGHGAHQTSDIYTPGWPHLRSLLEP